MGMGQAIKNKITNQSKKGSLRISLRIPQSPQVEVEVVRDDKGAQRFSVF